MFSQLALFDDEIPQKMGGYNRILKGYEPPVWLIDKVSDARWHIQKKASEKVVIGLYKTTNKTSPEIRGALYVLGAMMGVVEGYQYGIGDLRIMLPWLTVKECQKLKIEKVA
ncbi:hypothetical protein [Shewanella sp.]|uniref:hypothetical protein n=1 Tax=Shewanella sp. TaxID=50422 RepID=UPI00405435CE